MSQDATQSIGGQIVVVEENSCTEFFPRLTGDVDGDGRADLVGFDQNGVIYQSMPYVTPLQTQ